MTTEQQILERGKQWADAEVRGDVAALDTLTTDDFTLVGPLGFVLDKQQWLARYPSGGLVTQRLDWTDVQVRSYGTTAVSVGVHTQEAKFQGNPADGRFRVTHIWVKDGEQWRLAGQHLSPIGAMPFEVKR